MMPRGEVANVVIESVDPRVPHVTRLALDWLAEAPGDRVAVLDGALVMIDLSGFTRLSERLARLGHEGAETLSDSIDAVFGQLLAPAYARGGRLIKFGGDALLLWFAGAAAVRPATASAEQMRRTLRTCGQLATPVGRVALRMSAGVHVGPTTFFLVGHDFRELIPAGPAVSTTLGLEAAARSGQVLVSAEVATQLARGLTIAQPTGEFALSRRVDSEPGPVDESPPSAPAVLLEALLPPNVSSRLTAADLEAEHRQVSIGFVKVSGLDTPIATARSGRDLAAVAEVVDGLVSGIQAVAAAHEVTWLGTDVDRDGFKVVLATGAPSAREDDAERMLLAAHEIAHLSVDERLRVRVGVNRGRAFVGPIGPAYRRTFTAMGDTVNLAARLMAHAREGTVVISPGALRGVRLPTEVTELPAFMAKGKRRPVPAVRLDSVRPRRGLDARTRGTFVGRASELTLLREARERARHGEPTTVRISGDVGSGKTRLLDELLRDQHPTATELDAGRLVRLRAERYERDVPYAVSQQLLRHLLDVSPTDDTEELQRRLTQSVTTAAPDVAPWLPLVATAAGVTLPPTPEVAELAAEHRGERLALAVRELTAAIAPRLELFVDDAQWVDAASADVLAELIRRPAPHHCIVWAHRTDRSEPPLAPVDDTRHVWLGPLDPDSVTVLADSLTSEPLAPSLVQELARRSGGNPLFVGELVAASMNSDGVLPDNVEAAVAARLDLLPPRAGSLVKRLSVLGVEFDLAAAEAVAPAGSAEELAEQLDQLPEFLIAEEGHWRFAQTSVRDVAYSLLPFRSRRELHARIAEQLADDPAAAPADLSFHYFLAGRWADAWTTSRAAGTAARNSAATAEAVTFLRRALTAARHLVGGVTAEERGDVAANLARVLETRGDFGEAMEVCRRARRELPSGAAFDRLLLREAWLASRAGRLSLALRRAGSVARSAGSRRDAEVLATAELALGSFRQLVGRPDLAEPFLRSAIVRAAELADDDTQAQARMALDWALFAQGKTDPVDHSGQALELFEAAGDLAGQAAVCNNLGAFAYWRGDWTRAGDYYERSRTARERTGDEVNAALATYNIGEILNDQGDWDGAEVCFRRALRASRATGYEIGVAFAEQGLGRAAARRGDGAAGEMLLASAAARFDATGDPVDAALTRAWQAEAATLGMRPDDAIATLDALGPAPSQPNPALVQRIRGVALAQLGERAEAIACVEAAAAAAERTDDPFELAQARLVLARLSADPQDRGRLDDLAAGTLARLGVRELAQPWLPAAGPSSAASLADDQPRIDHPGEEDHP